MPLQEPNLSARCGVPNTCGFVIRCGDYAFPVRRESSGPPSPRVSDQSLLTVGDIPDASCPIDGTGDDAFTIRRERGKRHPIGVPIELLEFPATCGVPDACSSVDRRRNDALTVGRELG